MSSLVFHGVSFAYDASPDGLFSEIQFGLSEGWTGVIGENGSGKTTLLRLACHELAPRRGIIDAPRASVYCPQRTDAPLDESAAFCAADDAEAFRLRGTLGIERVWLDRWPTLSHGERKRVQIATSLWLRPDLLAVDEPTNHLDAEARRMVLAALRTYRGIGLLVSHDRELLDGLCAHSLFVSPPTVRLRSGGYTTATAARRAEDDAAQQERRRLREVRRRLERERIERRGHAQKAERAKSLHGVESGDHDAREKARGARDRDHGSGKGLRQLEGRLRQTSEREAALSTPPRRNLGINPRSSPSDRNAVVRLAAGSLSLGPAHRLDFPDLLVQPTNRIAVTGPNGGGKSTLVRHIVATSTLAPEHILYVPQEISAEESSDLLRRIRLSPSKDLGRAMQWVSRLGSDPERILESRTPSPGEVRKLLLALRLADEPQLILLDEPTNHMDLPSVECLETALRTIECALLLVSHDRRLLEALCALEWNIAQATATSPAFVLSPRAFRSGLVSPATSES